MQIPAALELLRPGQWLKNLLVFAGLAFAIADRNQSFAPWPAVWKAAGAVVAFCLASGAVYAFNDAADAAADRIHPEKRLRPVASGRISPAAARAEALLVLLLSLALASVAGGSGLTGCVVLYAALQVLYTMGLKRIPWIEIAVLAFGFPLRVKAGAMAAGVPVTPWIGLCTFSAALLVAAGKRRAEWLALGEAAPRHRAVLAHYSARALGLAAVTLASTTFACYAIWTLLPATAAKFNAAAHLPLTTAPVALGLARYLQIALLRGGGGRPERLFSRDPGLLASFALWAVSWIAVLS